MTAAESAALIKRIKEQGWDQGCELRPRRELYLASLDNPATDSSVRKRAEAIDAGDKSDLGEAVIFDRYEPEAMIVVSQRCDLVAAIEDEPLCEAIPLLVWPKDRGLPGLNSARRFVVDPAARVVADQSRRFVFEKSLLPDKQATQLIRDRNRWRAFCAWCARRYSRVAYADHFEMVFGEALKWAIGKEARREAEATLDVVHSIRLSITDTSDRTDVECLVVYDETREKASEVKPLFENIKTRVESRLPTALEKARDGAADAAIKEHRLAGMTAQPMNLVSARDLVDFLPFNLEHLTYRDDEEAAVEPHEELL